MPIEYIYKGLTHFHHVGATFAVTTQLNDAVPKEILIQSRIKYEEKIEEIKNSKTKNKELQIYEAQVSYEKELESLLHAKYNQEHLLAKPPVAQLVADKILQYHGEYYDCIAFMIMSNHIHLLLDFSLQLVDDWVVENEEPIGYVNLDVVMRYIKGGTSIAINRLLSRTGKVWRPGYYNRYIRNERHLAIAYQYILKQSDKSGYSKKDRRPSVHLSWG